MSVLGHYSSLSGETQDALVNGGALGIALEYLHARLKLDLEDDIYGTATEAARVVAFTTMSESGRRYALKAGALDLCLDVLRLILNYLELS